MYTLLYKFVKAHAQIHLNQCQGTSKKPSSDATSVTSSKRAETNKTDKHSDQDDMEDSDEPPKKRPKKKRNADRFLDMLF
jgi:hypothetical protein